MAAKNGRFAPGTAANSGGGIYTPASSLREMGIPYTPKSWRIGSEFSEFMSLLLHGIGIRRTDGEEMRYRDALFVKRCLVTLNCVGYRRMGDMWVLATGEGIDAWGFPERLIMRTARGFTFPITPAAYDGDTTGNYIIYGLPWSGVNLADIIFQGAVDIGETDVAIRQNLVASQAPWFAVVKDKNIINSVKQAMERKIEGAPAIVVSSDLGEAMKGVSFETPYIVDKLDQHRDALRDRLMNKVGIMSANVNKKERVQVGEVNAMLGQCLDFIGTLVDNVNQQFEAYNIPYELYNNTSTSELYTPDGWGEEDGADAPKTPAETVEGVESTL